MDKRSLFFGIGIGIIILSIIFYFSNIIFNKYLIIYNDKLIIERAKMLGMIFPKENMLNNNFVLKTDGILEEDKNFNEKDLLKKDNLLKKFENNDIEYIDINIPIGSNAMKISNILFEAGVINDPIEFQKFITKNNSSNILRAGKYKFKKSSSSEEVLYILLNKNEKKIK